MRFFFNRQSRRQNSFIDVEVPFEQCLDARLFLIRTHAGVQHLLLVVPHFWIARLPLRLLQESGEIRLFVDEVLGSAGSFTVGYGRPSSRWPIQREPAFLGSTSPTFRLPPPAASCFGSARLSLPFWRVVNDQL